jgi:hypothetical protein
MVKNITKEWTDKLFEDWLYSGDIERLQKQTYKEFKERGIISILPGIVIPGFRIIIKRKWYNPLRYLQGKLILREIQPVEIKIEKETILN